MGLTTMVWIQWYGFGYNVWNEFGYYDYDDLDDVAYFV